MTDTNQFNQLKMDTLRIEIEYERLDRKVDKLQSDVTSMRDELGKLHGKVQGIRGEIRNEIQGLRNEVHAGFDRLERIILKVLDLPTIPLQHSDPQNLTFSELCRLSN